MCVCVMFQSLVPEPFGEKQIRRMKRHGVASNKLGLEIAGKPRFTFTVIEFFEERKMLHLEEIGSALA